jgi:hypothetical protein
MILGELRELFTSHSQFLRFFIVSAAHEQFESSQLKLSELKLSHIRNQNAFTIFKILPNISLLIDYAFDIDLE